MVSIELPDEAATRRLGERLGQLMGPGDVVLLTGDLGAGKTTLVQGLAVGLGISDLVVSPTFALVHELAGRVPLRHLDLYRLTGPDLEQLGAEEWFEPDAAVAVEWAERLGPFRPAEHLEIDLAAGRTGRQARLHAAGERARALLAALGAGERRRGDAGDGGDGGDGGDSGDGGT